MIDYLDYPCKHCGEYTLIYNSTVADDYCESCGEWQSEDMKIISNYNWRFFKYGDEVPQSVHDDYDHLDDSERMDGWIKYRGDYYHLSDFSASTIAKGWQGIKGDSFFSGLVINVSNDGETYQIGLYLA